MAPTLLWKKGGGAYLRSTNSYDTLETAVLKAKELRGAGVYAYGGYIDGVSYVMTGIYGSAEEAASSVGDLAFTGLSFTPVSLDTKAVMVSAADCNIVFIHDAEILRSAPRRAARSACWAAIITAILWRTA